VWRVIHKSKWSQWPGTEVRSNSYALSFSVPDRESEPLTVTFGESKSLTFAEWKSEPVAVAERQSQSFAFAQREPHSTGVGGAI